MSEWSEKNSLKTSLSTTSPEGENVGYPYEVFGIKRSEFVVHFRKSSKKFILEILTKNIALNLSVALFFIGLGYSLKWWYKDKFFHFLLKQNLPAFSEPHQKISGETGDYVLTQIEKQQEQLVEKNMSISTLCSLFETNPTIFKQRPNINLSENEPCAYPLSFFAYPKAFVPSEGKNCHQIFAAGAYPLSDFFGRRGGQIENVNKVGDMAYPLFSIPYVEKDAKHTSQKYESPKFSLEAQFARHLKVSYHLINRIDLYPNQIVVKLKQPWQKHVYQRFVGIFAESNKNTKITKNSTSTKLHNLPHTILSKGQKHKNICCQKQEKFLIYRPWKPLFPKTWFKLSARNFCFLTSEFSHSISSLLRYPEIKNRRMWNILKPISFSYYLQTGRIESHTESNNEKNGILNTKLIKLRELISNNKNFQFNNSFTKSQTPYAGYTLKKLSYPLELTKTLTGWQPSTDILVLNSYLDEIPYKLENALQPYFSKKDSELLLLSTSFLKSIVPSFPCSYPFWTQEEQEGSATESKDCHQRFACFPSQGNQQKQILSKNDGNDKLEDLLFTSFASQSKDVKQTEDVFFSPILPADRKRDNIGDLLRVYSNRSRGKEKQPEVISSMLPILATNRKNSKVEEKKSKARDSLPVKTPNSFTQETLDTWNFFEQNCAVSNESVDPNLARPYEGEFDINFLNFLIEHFDYSSVILRQNLFGKGNDDASDQFIVKGACNKASEINLKKSHLFEIKKLLQKELQVLINTLSLVIIDSFFPNEHLQTAAQREISNFGADQEKSLKENNTLLSSFSSSYKYASEKKHPILSTNKTDPTDFPTVILHDDIEDLPLVDIEDVRSKSSMSEEAPKRVSVRSTRSKSSMSEGASSYPFCPQEEQDGKNAEQTKDVSVLLSESFCRRKQEMVEEEEKKVKHKNVSTMFKNDIVDLTKKVLGVKTFRNLRNNTSFNVQTQVKRGTSSAKFFSAAKQYFSGLNAITNRQPSGVSITENIFFTPTNINAERVSVRLVDKNDFQKEKKKFASNIYTSPILPSLLLVSAPSDEQIFDVSPLVAQAQGQVMSTPYVCSASFFQRTALRPSLVQEDIKNLPLVVSSNAEQIEDLHTPKGVSTRSKSSMSEEAPKGVSTRSFRVAQAQRRNKKDKMLDAKVASEIFDATQTFVKNQERLPLSVSDDQVKPLMYNSQGICYPLLLVNNLGFNFNNFSSLTNPTILLPTSTNSYDRLGTPNEVRLWQQLVSAKLNSRFANMVALNKMQSLFGNSKVDLHAIWNPKKNTRKNYVDTLFHLNQNNLTWEIFQHPKQKFYKDYKIEGKSNDSYRSLLPYLRDCFAYVGRKETFVSEEKTPEVATYRKGNYARKKINFKQKETTIKTLDNINLVDKTVNFANKKSRCMSGYVYPDLQSDMLKDYLYQWLLATPLSLVGTTSPYLKDCHQRFAYGAHSLSEIFFSCPKASCAYPFIAYPFRDMHGMQIFDVFLSEGRTKSCPSCEAFGLRKHKEDIEYLHTPKGVSTRSKFSICSAFEETTNGKSSICSYEGAPAKEGKDARKKSNSYLETEKVSFAYVGRKEPLDKTVLQENFIPCITPSKSMSGIPKGKIALVQLLDKACLTNIKIPITHTTFLTRHGHFLPKQPLSYFPQIEHTQSLYPFQIENKNSSGKATIENFYASFFKNKSFPYYKFNHYLSKFPGVIDKCCFTPNKFNINRKNEFSKEEIKKFFVNSNKRKIAYNGIVVQRNNLTKDFQPFKEFLEKSSIWGAHFLGTENPLTDRQCHFFGQKQLSTLDTNSLQRDYLRQLGKEILMQSNSKGFTELSKFSSIERTKILSFSKKVNSFIFKKRKYSYLLEPNDQWHILFQEQLRTALENCRKYPLLHTEASKEAKLDATGRIKVSAPLIMARFPKEIAKSALLGNKQRPIHSLKDARSNLGTKDSILSVLLPDKKDASSTNEASFLSGRRTESIRSKTLEPSLEHGMSWRPSCFLGSSCLVMPRLLPSKLFNFVVPSPYYPTSKKFLFEDATKQPSLLSYLQTGSIQNYDGTKIIRHYPLFSEKSYLDNTPWLNNRNNRDQGFSNFSSFAETIGLHSLIHESLHISFWAVLNQWVFLIALLLWIEQILLNNVLPSLFALEQILLGVTGIKTGDRTHVIRISKNKTPKFQNLAGIDGLLGELSELVLFLRGQRKIGERFWNKKNSYGVLLTGAPGTGKTFLVRALANEANIPVLILSASTLVANKFNSNKPSWSIRHAFRRAKQLSPCILFIDEIDVLGKSRGKIITDINEIITEASLENYQNPYGEFPTAPDKILSSNIFSYEQFGQNWPSVSNLLLNKWENTIKSTLFQEFTEINQNSLCKEKLFYLLKENMERESNSVSVAAEGKQISDLLLTSSMSSNDNPDSSGTNLLNKTPLQKSTKMNLHGERHIQDFEDRKDEMFLNSTGIKENNKRKFGPLTQLLVSMDGVNSFSGVLIMGATNRPELLDPALIRPGRFEKIIRIDKPSEQSRIEILQLYSQNLGVQHKIPWSYLANRTRGLTTADLAVAMNYSSLKAISEGSTHTIETIEYGLNSIAR